MLRRLWPEWEPTDEIMREVWFKSFDKPHALQGAGTVNHDALHDAIVEHRKTSPYPRPEFLKVSDLYRMKRQTVLAELERVRMGGRSREDERKEIDAEHARRIEEILKWPLSRIEAARQEVARYLPNSANKSGDVRSWSAVYSGMVKAADKRLQGATNEGRDSEDHER